jgi:hypothetical protein
VSVEAVLCLAGKACMLLLRACAPGCCAHVEMARVSLVMVFTVLAATRDSTVG